MGVNLTGSPMGPVSPASPGKPGPPYETAKHHCNQRKHFKGLFVRVACCGGDISPSPPWKVQIPQSCKGGMLKFRLDPLLLPNFYVPFILLTCEAIWQQYQHLQRKWLLCNLVVSILTSYSQSSPLQINKRLFPINVLSWTPKWLHHALGG